MSQLQFQCPPQGGSHAPAMPSTAAATSPQPPMPMGGQQQQQQHAPQPGYSNPCATGGTPQPGYTISCATGGGGGTPQPGYTISCATGGGGGTPQPGYSIGCATGGGGGTPQPGYSIGCATGGGGGTPQPGYSMGCATGGGVGTPQPPMPMGGQQQHAPQPGYAIGCATGGGTPQPVYSLPCATGGGGTPQSGGYSSGCATGGGGGGGGGGGPSLPGYSISCATGGGGGGGGPPQPGYSIPCATGGTLPSESASHPLRSSALPSGSATPFTPPSPTTVSNMANPKEKTPMCLVNELARFNKIQPEYKLLSEEGPAHSKIFSVRLTLGEQHWEADGTSIKKAQHTAASSALAETTLPKPTARSPRNTDCMTHTMELNALCMKLGKKPVYKPVDPYLGMRPPNFNYNVRSPGPYQRSMQQYYYPFPPVGPMLYHIELSIGGQQFHGKGRTRQLAKHDAAARALKLLQKEPMVEQLPAMNGDPEEEEENLNKSEISQVFEISLKRNLPVNFEVLKEAGPPHMKSFVVRVAVGEFSGEGEGKSKKIAKKLAATSVLEELRKLPHIPTVEKMLPRMKKKTKSIIKLQTSPEYGQGMNPISRLAQIQQAKKEKEPEYCMVTERGLPRRREFVMQVTVCSQCAEGMGPSKKVAKRNAAEKMLELLGYKVPQPQPPKPALKTDEKLWTPGTVAAAKVPIKKPGDGRKVTFYEEEATMGAKDEDYRLPYLNHQQLPAGILPMVPEVAQAVGASCHSSHLQHGKDYKRPAPNPAVATLTAMIANELLYAGTSPTAETVLKNSNQQSPALPHGPLTRPSEQLGFLASVQGLQVEYKDFPKNNKNEFVSLINCSSQPPLISHGIGKDVESCHDMAALNILKLLSELDQQQPNDRTGNGPISGCGKQQEMDTESLLKQANSCTLAQTLDGTV